MAASAVPRVPPAPGLLSTTSCWPRSAATRWVTTRATRSVAPLAGKGTITRTGRSGQLACACAADASTSRPARPQTPRPQESRRIQSTPAKKSDTTEDGTILGSCALLDQQHFSKLLCHHGKPAHTEHLPLRPFLHAPPPAARHHPALLSGRGAEWIAHRGLGSAACGCFGPEPPDHGAGGATGHPPL
ncbi:hypothetical protein D3C71_1645080 [compost metagenome]